MGKDNRLTRYFFRYRWPQPILAILF